MELVYLWVEEYKNIHNQGFNFSPRFSCKYDDIKNELTIKENDDYIENFFGKNINVTAIVGKNGSGKSSVLELLGKHVEFKEVNSLVIYKKEEIYYCEYKNIQPNIIFDKEIVSINKNKSSNILKTFHPQRIKIAYNEKIGKDGLSYYYFGNYSNLFGNLNIERQNFYNMLEAQFFVPRYINIAIDNFEIFKKLKQMYKFDRLRLLLRNNSTVYLRRWIDKEIVDYRDYNKITSNSDSRKVCIYEKNEETINDIAYHMRMFVNEDEIHLYNRDREKIVSHIEDIERMHRNQTFENQIDKFNKYQEFDLGVLIAFVEYYLKNTFPCDSSELLCQELLILKEEIKKNARVHEYLRRIGKGYILDFFKNLKNKNFEDINNDAITIDKIIQAIEYLQSFEIFYFDKEGNPYIDIPIDEYLKENINHIKVMQKIFSENDFDCGSEKYLRVFEYNLMNSQIGSSYETISDGEKHFIRFLIDILYHLKTLKNYNFTPDKENLAIFLADEPDNAMHPLWKKRLIVSALEVFNNTVEIPNITIHFIYTTHSPFLLSDIPKQNIIFLDTYTKEDKEVKNGKQEIGNCKVLSHDEVLNKKQTFGANIHTLLSDSFFMEDGLMGEFAKNKIRTIKVAHRYILYRHKRKTLFKQSSKRCRRLLIKQLAKFWQIQEIIGEPFLQKIVKNQLEEMELILLGKKEAIDNEISRLQALKASLR